MYRAVTVWPCKTNALTVKETLLFWKYIGRSPRIGQNHFLIPLATPSPSMQPRGLTLNSISCNEPYTMKYKCPYPGDAILVYSHACMVKPLLFPPHRGGGVNFDT